jgi:hypothetical protein
LTDEPPPTVPADPGEVVQHRAGSDAESHPPAEQPRRPVEGPWGYRLQRGVILVGIIFGIELLTLGFLIGTRNYPGDVYGYAMLATLAAGAVLGLARFVYVMAVQLQSRLSEWILTLFAAGILAPAQRVVLQSATSFHFDPDSTHAQIWLMVVAVLVAMLGSAWGWNVCRRAALESGWERLRVLAAGWLLIYGLAALAIFVLFCIIFLSVSASRGMISSDVNEMFSKLALFSLLTIPGFLIEWKLRRQRR